MSSHQPLSHHPCYSSITPVQLQRLQTWFIPFINLYTAIKQGSHKPQTPPPLCCYLIRQQEVAPCVRCLQRVFLRAVYSQAQGCVWAAPQLGGDVEQPWLVCRYDVIHKTGSRQHITTPLQEDRATAMGNMHKNCEDRTCSPEDMIADRQTHRHTQTHSSQYSASLLGAE